MKKNIEINMTCPNCGANLKLVGTTNETDNKGWNGFHPAPESDVKPISNKASERIQALKDAGVDVSNLFAMQGAAGDGMIARMTNGLISVVPEDDPIFDAIKAGGTVPDRRLFRRWVTSQMFHMLTERDWKTGEPVGFTQALHNKGFEYQFEMVLDELKTQMRLAKQDGENFRARNRWFNIAVVYSLCKDYTKYLNNYISSLKRKNCKGVPYVHVGGRNVFCADITSKITHPLTLALNAIHTANTPEKLYNAFRKFNALRVKLPFNTPQSAEWIKAYKGSGAYYTMKNLIMFHGCRVYDRDNKRFFSEDDSLAILEAHAVQYAHDYEGWRMMGFMNEFLDDNKVDILAKMNQWRAKR